MSPGLRERLRAEAIRRGLRRPVEAENPYPTPLSWLEAARPPVVHPTMGRLAFVARPYQRELLEAFGERYRLVVKARQIGITQGLALEAYWKARHAGRPLVLCVSRNEDQAKQFVRYAREAAVFEGVKLLKDNELELEFGGGTRIKAQAATRSAGRGFPASDVYLDELAFAPWASDIYQSIEPTVSTGGTLTVFSSPKGRANLFYLLWAGRYGQEQWWRRSYSWRVLWDEAWAQAKRATMTREGFAEEYEAEEGFIASGDEVFDAEDVEACYRSGCLSAWRPNREYRLYADVAGSGKDATVLQVWDVTEKPYRLVAHDRWVRAKFERLYTRAVEMARAYEVEKVRVDQTGLGAAIPEELSNRLGEWGIPVDGFTFTAKSKERGLTALQLLVEQRELAFDVASLRTEALLYQRDDEGLVTDEVMTALLMADDMRDAAGGVADISGLMGGW